MDKNLNHSEVRTILVGRFANKWVWTYAIPLGVLGTILLSMLVVSAYTQYTNGDDKYSVYTTADKDIAVVISGDNTYLVPKDSVEEYKDNGTEMTYQKELSEDNNDNNVVVVIGAVILGMMLLGILGYSYHKEVEVNKMEEEWHKTSV
jgi:hypothetical protein